ncbi:MAG TPA: hypothetical protein VFC19_43335 [Candidatus Limnocylindrales bacterium]|nr:hypothetical protein [Candidatus Limnocylindrales bacterium]
MRFTSAARLRSLLVRIWLLLVGTALAAASTAAAQPSASPTSGTLTVDFVDVCGFVRADPTYTGPGFWIKVAIRRNGVELNPWGEQVYSRAPVYQYAADGDTITWTWELAGAMHKAEHVHRTPVDCDEPKLSFKVLDDCTTHSKLLIDNDGQGSISLIISSDTAYNTVTVPPGGTKLSIVGGLVDPGATGRIQIYAPHPTEEHRVLVVAEVRRSSCDGADQMPRSESPQSVFEATCTGKVSVVWINGENAFEGVLRLYHNGSVAKEETVAAGGVYQFQLDAAEGDVIAVGGPDGPHGTYTYRQANCSGANGGGLPRTGVAAGSLILIAAGLVGIGLFLRRLARRRRPG